jgi:hypothetical protein
MFARDEQNPPLERTGVPTWPPLPGPSQADGAAPEFVCCCQTSARRRFVIVHNCSPFVLLPFIVISGKQKTLLTSRKQGERNFSILQNLPTPDLSNLRAERRSACQMDNPGLNAQPRLYHSCRVAFAIDIVSTLAVDMLMQFLIERENRYHIGAVAVHLYFRGWQHFKFEYPHQLMDRACSRN